MRRAVRGRSPLGSSFPSAARAAVALAALAAAACLPGAPAARAEEPDLAARLAPYYAPPADLANDFGPYTSPLLFDNGQPVKTADQWPARRAEILAKWHKLMGPWPPPLENPRLEYLATVEREGLTEHHLRLEVAPDRFTEDAYLLVPPGAGPFPAALVVYYEAKTGVGRSDQKLRDFALGLAKRGFVALSLGCSPGPRYPSHDDVQLQPLSFQAYMAANCHTALAKLPRVDGRRIGVAGHSYGAKWSMFAACLYEPFACAAWSDGGVVFDEKRSNVNYWEPWYLGYEPGVERRRGVPSAENPRTGAYRQMIEQGRDLHELHALMAPRPFLVSGGSEDGPQRWKALNHARAVCTLLGHDNRVAMTNRPGHTPTEESNARLYDFFEYWLKPPATP